MEVFHHSCFSMGTRFNVVVPGYAAAHGEELVAEIRRILRETENLLSCYDSGSELSAINRLAFKNTVEVSDEMARVIELMAYFWAQTGGAFDAGLLYYASALKNNPSDASPHWRKVVGWESVQWDGGSRKIRFLSQQTGLDAGGFGKGWALEKVVLFLKTRGVQSAFISFGESSIAVIGTHPLGGFWPLTVTHSASGQSLDVQLVDESVSVSGLLLKTIGEKTEYKPHIVRVKDGSVARENVLAVVKTVSPMEAEVISTAAISAGMPGKAQLERDFPHASINFLI